MTIFGMVFCIFTQDINMGVGTYTITFRVNFFNLMVFLVLEGVYLLNNVVFGCLSMDALEI